MGNHFLSASFTAWRLSSPCDHPCTPSPFPQSFVSLFGSLSVLSPLEEDIQGEGDEHRMTTLPTRDTQCSATLVSDFSPCTPGITVKLHCLTSPSSLICLVISGQMSYFAADFARLSCVPSELACYTLACITSHQLHLPAPRLHYRCTPL